mmetsp:Transcript_50021/g.143809  ORF Transcript_50021/g.143809 Transcript_50021/m.143809 type:complete len:221 (+) Transcript_50021:381-1043(+)
MMLSSGTLPASVAQGKRRRELMKCPGFPRIFSASTHGASGSMSSMHNCTVSSMLAIAHAAAVATASAASTPAPALLKSSTDFTEISSNVLFKASKASARPPAVAGGAESPPSDGIRWGGGFCGKGASKADVAVTARTAPGVGPGAAGPWPAVVEWMSYMPAATTLGCGLTPLGAKAPKLGRGLANGTPALAGPGAGAAATAGGAVAEVVLCPLTRSKACN